jgi:hypothetical protein
VPHFDFVAFFLSVLAHLCLLFVARFVERYVN